MSPARWIEQFRQVVSVGLGVVERVLTRIRLAASVRTSVVATSLIRKSRTGVSRLVLAPVSRRVASVGRRRDRDTRGSTGREQPPEPELARATCGQVPLKTKTSMTSRSGEKSGAFSVTTALPSPGLRQQT